MNKKEGESSKGQILVFKVLALSLPFLLVFLTELSLRVFNIGEDYSVFIFDQSEQFKQLNPKVSEKYFLNQANATEGFTEAFQSTKGENTIRIFVMGASTAVGFPYFHNGSFHRMLEYRLQNTFPDINFEIINTGLTAINSYTLVDFSRAIAEENPDAVLIYAGHNEYYGALGVGSTSKLGNNPWIVRTLLKARDIRIVQIVFKLRDLFIKNNSKVDLSETLMQRMAEDQAIYLNSESYEKGLEQFEHNLNRILRHLHKKNIPVFISTVVSNLKDQPPLLQEQSLPDHIGPELNILLNEGDTSGAISTLEKGILNSGNNAMAHYTLAQLYFGKGQFEKAKKEYERSKELDPLRFRAPEAINEIIIKQAAAWNNVKLVDVKAQFEKRSPGGVPGQNLFLEHLHPNAQGYFLISETFTSAMKESKLIANEWPKYMDSKEFWTYVPFTKVDSLYGIYKTWMLKEQWPFNEPIPEKEDRERTFEEKIAGGLSVNTVEWGDGMNAMYEHYLNAGELGEALKITESLILEFPFDMRLYDRVGSLCEKMGKINGAFIYYKRAFEIQPSEKLAEKAFIAGLKEDKSKEVVNFLRFAVEHDRGKVSFSPLYSLVMEINSLKSQLQQDSTNTKLLSQIAASYLQMGNLSAASKYAKKVLEIDDTNELAQELIDRYTL